MPAPMYHTGQRGAPGFEVPLANAVGAVSRAVIPAVAMVDSTGNSVAAGSASDPTYTQSAPLPAATDRSGTTSATAGTSTTLAAANTARRGLNVQNVSAGTIGVNEFGGVAVIGNPGTYTIAAGSALNMRTNRAINVVGSAASLAYTATEF